MAEIKSHELVAGIEASKEDGGIGLCAGVRLHVGILGAEQLADALDGQVLALVDNLATAIIAFAGIALGVLVRHVGTHGLHDLIADKVFGGNQFDAFQLTLMLFFDKIEDFVVLFHCFW